MNISKLQAGAQEQACWQESAKNRVLCKRGMSVDKIKREPRRVDKGLAARVTRRNPTSSCQSSSSIITGCEGNVSSSTSMLSFNETTGSSPSHSREKKKGPPCHPLLLKSLLGLGSGSEAG